LFLISSSVKIVMLHQPGLEADHSHLVPRASLFVILPVIHISAQNGETVNAYNALTVTSTAQSAIS
jgi:hypothetical protein